MHLYCKLLVLCYVLFGASIGRLGHRTDVSDIGRTKRGNETPRKFNLRISETLSICQKT